ncbi:CCDC90 family protein [Mycoavidus sp. SF9855]|uniref:CCDC90 family protein n=1 Tax=Mycoavidus sp. SF9855 TaxID=2968475 RepID=UPI00211CA26B|nr:CCDC90 family protein [Mycoavidus sp. SF9855]UUM21819.1 CCDC90 family protein [Mycoavidus sp. SF9855]
MAHALNLKELRNLVMAIAIFDTLKFSKRLKEAGVPSAQAEAEAEVLSEIFAVNLQELPAKEDLHAVKEELRHEISDLRKDMDLKFEQTISTLRGEISGLGNNLRGEISGLREEASSNKFELLKWFIGIAIAQVGLIIGILKFLPGNI